MVLLHHEVNRARAQNSGLSQNFGSGHGLLEWFYMMKKHVCVWLVAGDSK